MSKNFFLIILLLLLLLAGCGQETAVSAGLDVEPKEGINLKIMSQAVNKKILLIIAHQDYQDAEYGDSRTAFEAAGASVAAASSAKTPAKGKLGGEAIVDLTLADVDVVDYDAIVFIGGPGAEVYVGNDEVNRIAREAVGAGKVLAAICIAPKILADAGVLQGRRATVWHSSLDKEPVEKLKAGGAEFADEPVVVDGKIITGNGPQAAADFAQAVLKAVANNN